MGYLFLFLGFIAFSVLVEAFSWWAAGVFERRMDRRRHTERKAGTGDGR